MEDRKNYILNKLNSSNQPTSASEFGRELGVSRQVIVNDIALLRATGEKITATPRGYIIEKTKTPSYIIACKHGKLGMKEELYTIIECGCGVIDVVIEHDIYGQISANLCLYTIKEVDEFLNKINDCEVQPLCRVTNEYHFHHLSCPTNEHFEEVKRKLKSKGICL